MAAFSPILSLAKRGAARSMPNSLKPAVRHFRAGWQRRSRNLHWRVYGRSWIPSMGTADAHFDWLCESGLMEGARNVFSIGPGTGDLELRLVRAFDLDLGYSEPYKPFRTELEGAAVSSLLASRVIERQASEYRPGQLSRRYDLILSVHSWYELGLDPEILEQTLAALSRNGTLLISVLSRSDFFVRERLTKPSSLVAEDLFEWVAGLGLECRLHTIRRELPMDLLIRAGRPTRVGDDVLSFFAGPPSRFRSNPARTRRRERLLRNQNRRQFTRSHGVIVIPAAAAASSRISTPSGNDPL